MSRYLKVSIWSLFLLFGVFSLCFAEDITITTYYPAPYGSYQELQLAPHSVPITVCDDAHKGVMYYDSDDEEIKVCRGTAAGWQANDYWEFNGVTVYPQDANWNVEIGTVAPGIPAKLRVRDGAVVFDGAAGATPISGAGRRMMWIPAKAAFRAGRVADTQWDNANIGTYSVGMGDSALASGNGSVAIGSFAKASAVGAVALGVEPEASGWYSTAIGNENIATGRFATAMGSSTTAQARGSMVIGRYNIISGNPVNWVDTDPLFVIGNGSGAAGRSNAMTVLKNGNVGIGTATPNYLFHVFKAGAPPVSPNKEMFFDADNGAFVAGAGAQANVYSVAMGYAAQATGMRSVAIGASAVASGDGSAAFGGSTQATGYCSSALGENTEASGDWSVSLGSLTKAIGDYSTTMGFLTRASGDYSLAMGREIEAAGAYSVAIGLADMNGLQVTLPNTMAIMGGKVGIGTVNPGAYQLYVNGNAYVSGVLSAGTKSFLIDHPLDPENKVLRHSSVESPDIKNIYDGTVILDENGEAVVELPAYFQALNKDFRYQLTCVGRLGLVYVKEKIANNKFVIAGGVKGLEVSWQVTGIRKDAQALKNPVIVEEEKGADNSFIKGEYLCPDCFPEKE